MHRGQTVDREGLLFKSLVHGVLHINAVVAKTPKDGAPGYRAGMLATPSCRVQQVGFII